ACGAKAEPAACSALDNFNVTTLQAQILATVHDQLVPGEPKEITTAKQDELKQSATQLRSTADAAEENLKNALNQAALTIDDAAKNQPNVDMIVQAFTNLGEEVKSTCNSDS